MTAHDITIAITLYNRREYLRQSIGSALDQTVPVNVMVVEDCGPDPTLQDFVRQEFGGRVRYVRNPRRRGIFGNWNACIEQCPTPWLSILHDDDYLKPGFIAAMLELHRQAGERGLYYGHTLVMDDHGAVSGLTKPPVPDAWKPVTVDDVIWHPPFEFPGQLFRADYAKVLGGFRETSLFTGEWEFWIKLILHHGAAQTRTTVAAFRHHTGFDRGTMRIFRSGKTHALITVQRKRNVALARSLGKPVRFDRQEMLARCPMPSRYLLEYAAHFSPFYLRYNCGMFRRSKPPTAGSTLFWILTQVLGQRFVRSASIVWNRFKRARASPPSAPATDG